MSRRPFIVYPRKSVKKKPSYYVAFLNPDTGDYLKRRALYTETLPPQHVTNRQTAEDIARKLYEFGGATRASEELGPYLAGFWAADGDYVTGRVKQGRPLAVAYSYDMRRCSLESIVAAFAHILDGDPLLSNQKKQDIFSVQMQAQILANRSFVTSLIQQTLRTFYRKWDTVALKKAIEEIPSVLLYVVNINFESAASEHFFNETPPNPQAGNRPKNIAARAFEQLSKDPETRYRLLVKALGMVLHRYRQDFVREMQKSIPAGIVEYFAV